MKVLLYMCRFIIVVQMICSILIVIEGHYNDVVSISLIFYVFMLCFPFGMTFSVMDEIEDEEEEVINN
jgi:hypothetical protein